MGVSVRAALLGGALAMAATGCASVKKPSATYAARAARAQPTPGRAAVYVIRDTWKGSDALVGVSLDGKSFGLLSAHSYLFAEVLPREHLLKTRGASLAFTPQPDRAYFFMLSHAAFTLQLDPLAEEEGRRLVGKLQLSGDSAYDEGDEVVLPPGR